MVRLERELREVRTIVLQARSTGKPVEIKDAGLDPELVALRSRMDDLDQTLRQINGQIESLTHDLDQARAQLAALKVANAPAAPVPSPAGPLVPLNSEAATGQAAPAPMPALQPLPKPEQPEVPPAPRPAPSPGPESAKPVAKPAPTASSEAAEAYAAARQLLLDGQYLDASNALRDYVTRYGDTAADAPEARYWLGETLYVQDAYAEAAGAYIGALRGWPATPWAPDAVVKLSLSLIALKKPADACSTLDEFARRFPKPAPALASRAAQARAKAQCR
jgi:tol-pal system protein YbgF